MILGLFTQLGISKTMDAQNNEGFKIYPTSFGVSRNPGALVNTRTGANSGLWFTAPISSRTVVDNNTVKIICTVPPESTSIKEFVKEVYVFAKDSAGNDFMLALGQPSEEILYDPSGTVTLELQVSLADIDLTSTYVFNNTKAQELDEHINSINPHPEFAETLAKHGIFMPAGSYPQMRMGQSVEFPVEFEGAKAALLYGGVSFSAKYNGNELNGKNIVFDGIKTNDEIRADFNEENFPDTIEHNGSPAGVLPASTETLTAGTYTLADKDIVYKDLDGVYRRAIADGTIKSRVAGWAIRSKKTVVGPGFADIDSGFAIGTPIYLSGNIAGKTTNFNTNISIGVSLGDHMYFTGYAGDISADVSQEFDAVVNDGVSVGNFATTQEAIGFVPSNGRILVKKMELIKQTLNTMGKNLTFVFNGANTGWKRFIGQPTIFHLGFSQIPTQGTFRIEWENQETNDMPWNAGAALVQTEFNQLDGHGGFTVTGNFTDGFTFTSNDLDVYSLPAFVYVGRNEIQHFGFSAVPNNGTIRFSFDGQETLNYAFNDTLAQLQALFDSLSSTENVIVTGDFATGFTVEFTGGWLEDGNKEQNLIIAVANSLYNSGVQVAVNGVVPAPINSAVLQKGKTPASNLYNDVALITISRTMIQVGEEVGPDRLMTVTSPVMSVSGIGMIDDFREGFVLDPANTIIHLQARMINTDRPVMSLNKLPSVNYDLEVSGYAKDVVAQLRLSEHPTNRKRAIVSGIDARLPSGVMLSKTFDNVMKTKFDGAQIDFSLGKVYAADGITDIGLDFTVPVITGTYWKWYSVNLVLSSIDVALNQINGRISVLPASGEGTTKELAPKSSTDDFPIAMVVLRGALGEKEKTLITTIKDHFTTPLPGKTFILNTPSESVAFWFSDPALAGATPALALTADRNVEITTLVRNDLQSVVANKIKDSIDADAAFVATVIGNKVTVENAVLGAVDDADMGDTGFFKKILVQGVDTDVTGIDDIKNENIIQFTHNSTDSKALRKNTFITTGLTNYMINKIGGINSYSDAAAFLARLTETFATGVPTGGIVDMSVPQVPIGFLKCNGAAVSRATYPSLFDVLISQQGTTSETFNVSIASPALVTKASHGFSGGERLRFSTTGALPTGIDTATDYFVYYIDANSFRIQTIANVLAGTFVSTSGVQSGVHSYIKSLWGLGDGATTFNVPDIRGAFRRAWDEGRGLDPSRSIATIQMDAFRSHTHTQNAHNHTQDAHNHNITNTGGTVVNGGLGDIFHRFVSTNQPGGAVAVSSTTATNQATTATNQNTGGSETRPTNYALMPVIKY